MSKGLRDKARKQMPGISDGVKVPVPIARNITEKFAKGGRVHSDAKQDMKMLKSTVSKSCLKKGK